MNSTLPWGQGERNKILFTLQLVVVGDGGVGKSAMTDSKHSEASIIVFNTGIMVAAAFDGKRSLETCVPGVMAWAAVCLTSAGDAPASALFAFAAIGASFLLREDTGVTLCEAGTTLGEMPAAGVTAAAAAAAFLIAPFCWVMRIVFFPPFVAGSDDICLTSV